MKRLFEPTLKITSALFVIGLIVFFYFNFIGTGYRGFFDKPVTRAEEQTYWVILILLSTFTLLTGLFGSETTREHIKNIRLVTAAKTVYLWATLLFTALFVVAALLLALRSATDDVANLAIFASVSGGWACYLYKAIPATEA